MYFFKLDTFGHRPSLRMRVKLKTYVAWMDVMNGTDAYSEEDLDELIDDVLEMERASFVKSWPSRALECPLSSAFIKKKTERLQITAKIETLPEHSKAMARSRIRLLKLELERANAKQQEREMIYDGIREICGTSDVAAAARSYYDDETVIADCSRRPEPVNTLFRASHESTGRSRFMSAVVLMSSVLSLWSPDELPAGFKFVETHDRLRFAECAGSTEYACEDCIATYVNNAVDDGDDEDESDEGPRPVAMNRLALLLHLPAVLRSLEDARAEVADIKQQLKDLQTRKHVKYVKPPPPPPQERFVAACEATCINSTCAGCCLDWSAIAGDIAVLPCGHGTCLACSAGTLRAAVRRPEEDEEDVAQRLACALCRKSFPRGYKERALRFVIDRHDHLLDMADSEELAHIALFHCDFDVEATMQYLIDAARECSKIDLQTVYRQARAPVRAIDDEIRNAATSLERRALLRRRESAVQNAAADIFERVNRKKCGRLVDLHGLHAEEAVHVIKTFILPTLTAVGSVFIVTGRGKHSSRKESVVRRAAYTFLRESGVRVETVAGNDGAIRIFA